MRIIKKLYTFYLLLIIGFTVNAQISPGDLTDAHEHLEGISNCTQCHELGEHVSTAKCLACHKEVKSRTDQKKGFHSSAEVSSKNCTECHNEHHGRKFEIVHFDKDKFDHKTTGYILEGKHKEKKCVDCHKTENIKNPEIRKKKMTYLGLSNECLNCHKDYHQQTLSSDCASCHNYEAFKPASKFDHKRAKFKLVGKHVDVTCVKCHLLEKKDDKDFQRFTGVAFQNCTDCHKDVHENKFGNDCRKCHTEQSFHQISGIKTFDHSKTDFQLEGKHQTVDCKTCHKGKLTTPIKHDRCMDCHKDYHKGEFTKKDAKSDCKDCHSNQSFKESTFTLDRHNKSKFKLEGAHVATPCFSCHKKTEEWKFGNIDQKCTTCHENIHQNFIQDKFIPEGKCESCHNVLSWSNVKFDHKATKFELQGKHKEQTCRDCHFKKNNENQVIQTFNGLTTNCEGCHIDIHQKQFRKNGTTDCTSCHGFENWKAERFKHNETRFKLDGGHQNVECKKCHFENKTASVPFIQYKTAEIKCVNCHL